MRCIAFSALAVCLAFSSMSCGEVASRETAARVDPVVLARSIHAPPSCDRQRCVFVMRAAAERARSVHLHR